MKKGLFVFVILIGVLFVTACGNNEISLTKIADKYNKQEDIKSYAEMGYHYKATAKGQKLTLSVNSEYSSEVKLEFTLEDNILSGSYDLEQDSAFVGIFMINSLISTIEEFHGYKKGEISKSLTDERIMEYTLEKEGLVYKVDDNYHVDLQIDITKKIPLLDFSEVYITTEDLQDLKEYMDEGSAQKMVGYVMMYAFTMDGVSEVVIAEKDKLTKNSYNSLKSLLEVMFDSKKAVEYLENNYSGIEEGNKKFGGINIKVNATMGENDVTLPDKSYKAMKITIDQQKVKDAIK